MKWFMSGKMVNVKSKIYDYNVLVSRMVVFRLK